MEQIYKKFRTQARAEMWVGEGSGSAHFSVHLPRTHPLRVHFLCRLKPALPVGAPDSLEAHVSAYIPLTPIPLPEGEGIFASVGATPLGRPSGEASLHPTAPQRLHNFPVPHTWKIFSIFVVFKRVSVSQTGNSIEATSTESDAAGAAPACQ